MEKKSHALTIYLIKDSYNKIEEIIQEKCRLEDNVIKINDVGDFFYKKSFDNQPKWVTSLFANYDLSELFSSSASAVLIVNVKDRFFAICFGPAGRYILTKGVIEERFGLITTLNSVEHDSIRSIDTKTLEMEPIQTRTQASRATSKDNFGIDIQRDLVNSVSGIPKNESLGKCIVGKDSLRVTLKCNILEINDYLKTILDLFYSKEYKKDFGWIDVMKEERDLRKIDFLNNKLIEEVNKLNPQKFWLSVPEIIDWNDLDGFKYSEKETEDAKDDIHIKDFIISDILKSPIGANNR